MKTVAHWFLVGVFALHMTGGIRFAHLAECAAPETSVPCQCTYAHHTDGHVLAFSYYWAIQHHRPVCPGVPLGHGHDPQSCSTCQVLLTLATTPEIPAAVPAAEHVTFEKTFTSERPVANTCLSTLEARGPPAHIL